MKISPSHYINQDLAMDPGLDDLDRPLNKRGRETAKTVAAYLRRAKITPDLVLCSTAVRAKQTLEPIANTIKPLRVAFESRIYGVAQPELLKYLRGLPETVECALMIGHNPGLHDLALALADTKSRKRLPPAEGKFPTGITSAAQTRDRPGSSPAKAPDKKMAPSRSPTPRGGLAWYSETKTKLHLFLGARRGRHPLGQFNSPIVPEAVDGKPRGRGPPRPGGEVVISWCLTPVSTKSTFYLARAQP